MQIEDLFLDGLTLITPRVSRDERGYFFESYRDEFYLKAEIGPFVQDNISFSCKNTIRAFHFQSLPGQAKLVACLQGEIWDVAVDIRAGSPTFLKWKAILLNDKNMKQVYIPIGFLHGFCVLSDTAQVQYKVSSPYNPNTEKSVRWNDPEIGVDWPVKNPILSLRDQSSPTFQEIRDVVDNRK